MFAFADVIAPDSSMYHTMSTDSRIARWSLLIAWLIIAYYIVCLRRIFKKAGLHARWSLIPVYREFLWFKVGKLSWRWIFAPIVSWILSVLANVLQSKAYSGWDIRLILGLLCIILAGILIFLFSAACLVCNFNIVRKFNKSNWFGARLLLLNIIFIWILAFDKSTYKAEAK